MGIDIQCLNNVNIHSFSEAIVYTSLHGSGNVFGESEICGQAKGWKEIKSSREKTDELFL